MLVTSQVNYSDPHDDTILGIAIITTSDAPDATASWRRTKQWKMLSFVAVNPEDIARLLDIMVYKGLSKLPFDRQIDWLANNAAQHLNAHPVGVMLTPPVSGTQIGSRWANCVKQNSAKLHNQTVKDWARLAELGVPKPELHR